MNELLNSLTAGDASDQRRMIYLRFAYGSWTVTYTYDSNSENKIEVTIRGDDGESAESVVRKLHDRVNQIAQRGMPELRPALTYEH